MRNQERWKQTVEVKETPPVGTSTAALEHFQSLVKSYEEKGNISTLIIYMKKFLDSDWLRGVQF